MSHIATHHALVVVEAII